MYELGVLEGKEINSLVPVFFLLFDIYIDGATRGQLGPARVGGVLHSVEGGIYIYIFYMFFKCGAVKDSDETEVLPFLEALHYYSVGFIGRLIVESARLILFPG